MQFLNRNHVSEQLTMPLAIEAIEQLLTLQADHPNWVKCPERLVIPTFDESEHNTSGSHLSMPAVIFDGQHEYTVVKLVTICPDNPRRDLPTTTAVVTVSDNATGEILAFMDGVYITQVRTAALSGVATKYLAKNDSKVVSVIGCGGMAYEQLNAVLTVCPMIKQVKLWNRSPQGAHLFKETFQHNYPQWSVAMEVIDDVEQAVENADVINVATRAKRGLFSAKSLKAQAHINAIGAYQADMKEISNEVISACSHVIIDDIAGGRHEAGDLIQAHEAEDCAWTWADLTAELGDLVTQKQTINADKKTRSLFKSVGAASFDAAVALKLAKLAQQQPFGLNVDI